MAMVIEHRRRGGATASLYQDLARACDAGLACGAIVREKGASVVCIAGRNHRSEHGYMNA